MDPSRNTRRQSVVDFPKPEKDLAEWTSRIKAMQRQVDADEETEQRRLEEEIAAARQARLRRSRGSRPADGPDLSHLSPDDTSSYDRPRDATERYTHQSEALRKIIGQNSVHVPEATIGRPEGVSLASFMGGRASGPRLNKHAPQLNAHDPTQFNQPDVSTPHPVFGRGGIAMPGMMSKKDLGGGITKAKESSQKAISDFRAVASTLGRTSNDPPSNNYLRQPDEERRKSTSPTPRAIAGNAERYRPSASPTPSSTVHHQKSFDRSNNRIYGTEEAERYRPSVSPPPSSTPRSQKSFDRSNSRAPGSEEAERYRSSASSTPPSTLRPQKSFDRGNNRSYGTEDAERYRPSASPTPTSSLRPQKSFDRGTYGSEHTERYRPSVSPTPKPTMKAQRSFERNTVASFGAKAGDKYRPLPSPAPQPLSSQRSASPEKAESRFPVYHAGKYTPDLRSQKSWNKGDERPVSTQKTGGRERAISTPKPPVMEAGRGSNPPASSKPWTPSTPRSKHPSYLPSTQGRSTPSNRERTISTPNYISKDPLVAQPTVRSSVIATVSLARPIQPEPRTPATAPKISSSVVASPAFQKAVQPKDITPSISRLQGRGFVQNMVKASLNLETNSAPNSTTSSPAEKPRPSNLRKGSVLDRWQPQNQILPTSPTSPVKFAFNTPIRRATTVETTSAGRPAPIQASSSTLPAPSYLKPARPPSFTSEEPLTPRTTARMMEKMVPPTGNFGSATTAFVEEASVPSSIDDFGVKCPPSRGPVHSRVGDKSTSSHHSRTSELPAPTGKPLIHPTKDRAKRPKKASTNPQSRSEGPALSETVEISTPTVTQRGPSEDKTTHASLPDYTIGRLTEQWSNAGPIIPKASLSPVQAHRDLPKEPKQYAGIRHALPGMVKESRSLEPPTTRTITSKKSFERSTSIDITGKSIFNDSRIPVQASRIPSTGTRATVMEVAQALSEHAVAQDDTAAMTPAQSPTERRAVTEKEETRGGGPPPRSTLTPAPGGAAEKRKSSYDSFVTLPPLKEEATPAPSPANTFTRLGGRAAVSASYQPLAESVQEEHARQESSVVNLVHDDLPLPPVDLSIMLHRPALFSSPIPEDAKSISVDVMSIVGSNSTTPTKDENVFFESETLAIIHRFKLASGLVDTYVWGWLGKRSHFGEAEERKLHELARRYGTTPIIVRQCSEPGYLVRLLGGRLAIRQGIRAYWTAENTAMHLVRAVNDVIFIDEHDLNIENLCSAFSYCVSALGTVYVWYGTGSIAVERDAALEYAQTICGDFEIVELTQGENDDDEMFWMILGEASFADADYWRWRRSSSSSLDINPSVWRVDSSKGTETVLPVEFFPDEADPFQSVYIVNCIWELFVIVGLDARGHRRDIRLALDVANKYAQRVALARPHTPNVHVLVLPSRFPLDLRLHVRDMDESLMNRGNIPDHMNLVSLAEALAQLATTSWDRELLKDSSMLPLGVDSSNAMPTSSM